MTKRRLRCLNLQTAGSSRHIRTGVRLRASDFKIATEFFAGTPKLWQN